MSRSIIMGALGIAALMAPHLVSDADEFYPTEPGDTWTYESSVRGQFTNRVADSMGSGGAANVHIVSADASGVEQGFVVRKDGPRLYMGPNAESLTLLADFSGEIGVASPTQMGTQEATHTIVGRHENHDVFGIRFEEVVEVRIAAANGTARTYWFARGVGLVGMESDHPAMRVRLVRATVGGRVVGAGGVEPSR